jgi:hypothetical protein
MGRDPVKRHTMAWQSPNSPLDVPPPSSSVCFHFYSIIGKDFKYKLVFVPPAASSTCSERKSKETFKGPHFVKFIKDALPVIRRRLGSRPFRLIMDHAKQHKSKATKQALQDLGACVLEDFPAQSWDLDVIEFAWGMLNQNLVGHRARTKSGYLDAIKEAWMSVDQASINALVDSMPQRMHAVIQAKGQWLGTKK